MSVGFRERLDSQSLELLADAFGRSPVPKLVLGLDPRQYCRFHTVNDAFCELAGYRADELIGRSFLMVLDEGPGPVLAAFASMVRGERDVVAMERVLVRKDGARVRVVTQNVLVRDRAGRPFLVAEVVAGGSRPAPAAGAAPDREMARLRRILAVQRAVTAAATDRDSAVRAVADQVVELFPAADGAAVELVEGDQLTYVATAGTLAPFAGTRIPRTGSLSGIALSTDAPAHCPDTGHDPRVDRGMCERLGIGAMLLAPLHAENHVVGVLKVSAGTAHVFDDTDEQQLALLAESLSAALQHADDATRNAELLAERTRALTELSISEQRFRLAFDNSPLGLTLCSLRPADFGRYLQASPAMTTITGYTPAELTGMTFADLTHPDDLPGTRDHARRLLAGELDAVSLERRYLHKDGHVIWVTLRVAVVRDERGEAQYAVVQVEDVTAAREADAQLRRSARLFELIPAAVIVRDLDGTIRWWNDGATHLYGWPLTAAAGKSAHRLLHTTFPYAGGAAEQEEALRRDGYWNGHLDHITADGRTVNVLSRQVLHHPDPDHAQVLEVNSDVTAARVAEQALAESEARLRAQFANTGVGQVISALDGTLISANRAYAAMIGRTPEELVGRHDHDLVHPDDLVVRRRLLAGLFAGDSDAYTTEVRLAHADGHWVPVEWTISLVRDPGGHPKLMVGVLTDITARRAAEQARDAAAAALAERNTQLEAANQLKLDIIGMLGHEIGNPLTSIRGNAEILTDDWAALSDERRGRAIDAIARQAGRLDEIVREVLAMVTIETGTIRADRRLLRVREEIGRALWAVDGAESVPVDGPDAPVLCHPGHLQQILVNLLSNARKYGGGATAVRVSHPPGLVEITVEDDGPGVPEEFRDRLFERLARADRDAAAVNGTGLGLYIVRGLAQANHGDIRHEPNPAGGSRFILSLESPGSAPE
ncbi:PAS domain S-box protein [Actinoplanes oblitus]|uniref:histidine kinase n=1 Tax=Actinoplanes oblitus TaxID=3040509 RepID=A0ABY8W910_9ACTN|nr:PAS domain S-box protein [Actinoplanes oblitus]WIM93395.1 PAS domain S-box protein [Actinoplanes oblitus]